MLFRSKSIKKRIRGSTQEGSIFRRPCGSNYTSSTGGTRRGTRREGGQQGIEQGLETGKLSMQTLILGQLERKFSAEIYAIIKENIQWKNNSVSDSRISKTMLNCELSY